MNRLSGSSRLARCAASDVSASSPLRLFDFAPRVLLTIIAVVIALGFACGGATTAPPAALVGADDLVLVRNMLFVTSSDHDELRVLDLEPTGLPLGTREFLPAPDPIEPLSIPVITRPSRLTNDITWKPRTTNGGDLLLLGADDVDAGAYVFASRSSGTDISIIDSSRGGLIEVGRLNAGSPVTATAAWADPAHSLTHLYFTTWDGSRTTLNEMQLDLPIPTDGSLADFAKLSAKQHPFATLPDESVVDMIVIPGSIYRFLNGVPMCHDEGNVCLVVATRASQGRGGRVLLLDPETLQVMPLNIGVPIKKLATHPATDVGVVTFAGGVHDVKLNGSRWDPDGGCDGADGGCDRRDLLPRGGHDIAAGERIWGLIDEEACGNTSCSGTIAVDSITNAVPKDLTGNPMLPINLGDSLLSGLSLQPDSLLLIPPPLSNSIASELAPVSALGVIAGSNGTVAYFEGSVLSHLDLDPAAPAVYQADLTDPTQTEQDFAYGPVWDGGMFFADGAWHSDTIYVTHRGIIPGGSNLPSVDGDSFRFPSSGYNFTPSAMVGDQLVAHCAPGSASDGGTDFYYSVGEVDPGGFTAATDDAGIAMCQGRTGFDVRAWEPNNLDIVASNVNGFVLRCGANRTCTSSAQQYFSRPVTYDPTSIAFSIQFGPDVLADGGEVPEDWTWTLLVDDHFAPFVVGVDPSSVGCNTQLVGSVILDNDHQRTWVASPAANGILEIDQTNAVRGVDTGASLCYR